MRGQSIRNRRGAALFVALLLLTVLATLAVGAIMISGGTCNRRESILKKRATSRICDARAQSCPSGSSQIEAMMPRSLV